MLLKINRYNMYFNVFLGVLVYTVQRVIGHEVYSIFYIHSIIIYVIMQSIVARHIRNGADAALLIIAFVYSVIYLSVNLLSLGISGVSPIIQFWLGLLTVFACFFWGLHQCRTKEMERYISDVIRSEVLKPIAGEYDISKRMLSGSSTRRSSKNSFIKGGAWVPVFTILLLTLTKFDKHGYALALMGPIVASTIMIVLGNKLIYLAYYIIKNERKTGKRIRLVGLNK